MEDVSAKAQHIAYFFYRACLVSACFRSQRGAGPLHWQILGKITCSPSPLRRVGVFCTLWLMNFSCELLVRFLSFLYKEFHIDSVIPQRAPMDT